MKLKLILWFFNKFLRAHVITRDAYKITRVPKAGRINTMTAVLFEPLEVKAGDTVIIEQPNAKELLSDKEIDENLEDQPI